MPLRNVALALVVSLILTAVGALAYGLYPLVAVMVEGHEGAGIGAVGGDFLKSFLIVEPILFIVVLALLRWRSGKR